MAIPSTSYLLNGYKEFIIQNVDPSKLCPTDLSRGLKIKEDLIAMYTHEFLANYISNYEQLENEVAADPQNSNILKVLYSKTIKVPLPPKPIDFVCDDNYNVSLNFISGICKDLSKSLSFNDEYKNILEFFSGKCESI